MRGAGTSLVDNQRLPNSFGTEALKETNKGLTNLFDTRRCAGGGAVPSLCADDLHALFLLLLNVRTWRYRFLVYAKDRRPRPESEQCVMTRVPHTLDLVDDSGRGMDDGIVAFGPAAFNLGAPKIAYFVVAFLRRNCIRDLQQSAVSHSPGGSKRGISRCGLAAE